MELYAMAALKLRVASGDLMKFGLILLLALASACGGSQPKSDANIPIEHIELDPMLVRPGKNGAPSEALDVNDIFDRAYEAFSKRHFEEAAENYAIIIKYFPDNRFYLPSLYNSGLAYEKLERWADAVRIYERIIEHFPQKKDAKDAFYRLAKALDHLDEYERVVDLMTHVLLRSDLTTFDRVEAHVRRSNALLATEHYSEAISGFRSVLKINENAPVNDRVAYDSHYIVQTYFGLGRAQHIQVNLIKLKLPPERMGDDLKDKAELFLAAQHAYIRALSYHHPKWSMAAGYMIGRLYEDFYTDIFSAEIPDDLTEEQLAMYFEELRKQIRPLMVRAVQVYKKNLSLSDRIGKRAKDSEWVQVTSEHLERLRRYLDDPITQARAERFVRRGRSLKDMWAPLPVAQDSVEQALFAALSSSHPKKPAETSAPVQP